MYKSLVRKQSQKSFRAYAGLVALLVVIASPPLGAADRRTQLNDHWAVLADFVYLRRSHSSDKVLAEDVHKKRPGCPCDFSTLSTKDLINDMGFEPGARFALFYRNNPRMSWEVNFLAVQPWEAHKKRKDEHSDFFFPFHTHKRHHDVHPLLDPGVMEGSIFAEDFFHADEVKARYEADFWDCEFNYWRHFTPRWVDYFSLSGLLGLRYFHYDEHLKDAFLHERTRLVPHERKGEYKIRTKNQIAGLQIGANLQINPMHYFSWEFCTKVGLMADYAKQRTLLNDNDDKHVVRHFTKARWQDGVFADCSAMMEFYIFKHMNIHAGYQFLFLSGIATAEDQLSQKIDREKHFRTHGVAIIHGLFAGMALSF